MKKVVIIDGQGGRMGRALVEEIHKLCPGQPLLALGANTTATAAMMKAGAAMGATGENPVLVACRDADLIIGPIGIVIADSLLGEITPAMAAAIGQSRAQKILIPVSGSSYCRHILVGTQNLSLIHIFIATIINVTSHPYGNADMFYITPYYATTQIVYSQIAAKFGIFAGNTVYVLSIILGAWLLHLVFQVERP